MENELFGGKIMIEDVAQRIAGKIEDLKKLLPDGKPIGKTFETTNKFYYYDTVTGKILECQKYEYELVEKILDGNLGELYSYSDKELFRYENAIDNLICAIKNEKIFALSKFSHMASFDNYEKIISEELAQVTIELTERCNLRCGYCIYNEACEKSRDFWERDMPLEVALRAIDYAEKNSRSSKELYIGYYGGEPLLNYDVMIQSMRYAIEKIEDKKVYFSFTTNAVLLTEDKCKELSEIPDLSVTISLDGPQKWHDLYRKNQGGQGSFQRTIEGLRHLVEAFGYERAKKNILLSMVYAPPYSEERLKETQKFFEELTWLPLECVKFVTYPDEESMSTIHKYLETQKLLSKIKWSQTENDFSLLNYGHANAERKNIFTQKLVEDCYLPIRKRTVFDTIMDSITMNGCCVPGQRNVYITVDGKFKICERVGEIPDIGNLEEGIDVQKVKNIYLEGYAKQSIKRCSTCWYARLCSICYCGCYSDGKLDMNKKSAMCEERKAGCLRDLKSYFEILESDEKALDYLDNITIS